MSRVRAMERATPCSRSLGWLWAPSHRLHACSVYRFATRMGSGWRRGRLREIIGFPPVRQTRVLERGLASAPVLLGALQPWKAGAIERENI